ncbi:hypothetical protein STHU_45620 [Allostella humosa]|nr:hypothetical protein STHU_45620 [Stella humosa]
MRQVQGQIAANPRHFAPYWLIVAPSIAKSRSPSKACRPILVDRLSRRGTGRAENCISCLKKKKGGRRGGIGDRPVTAWVAAKEALKPPLGTSLRALRQVSI